MEAMDRLFDGDPPSVIPAKAGIQGSQLK